MWAFVIEVIKIIILFAGSSGSTWATWKPRSPWTSCKYNPNIIILNISFSRVITTIFFSFLKLKKGLPGEIGFSGKPGEAGKPVRLFDLIKH